MLYRVLLVRKCGCVKMLDAHPEAPTDENIRIKADLAAQYFEHYETEDDIIFGRYEVVEAYDKPITYCIYKEKSEK